MQPPRLAALATGAVSLAVAAAAVVPAAEAARHHHAAAKQVHRGFYDCWAYTGTFTYLGTYEFKTPGRYALGGLRKGTRLYGKVDHGRYRIKGRTVIPTSGPMKRNHDHMWIKNANELLLRPDRGGGLAVGCYWYKL